MQRSGKAIDTNQDTSPPQAEPKPHRANSRGCRQDDYQQDNAAGDGQTSHAAARQVDFLLGHNGTLVGRQRNSDLLAAFHAFSRFASVLVFDESLVMAMRADKGNGHLEIFSSLRRLGMHKGRYNLALE